MQLCNYYCCREILSFYIFSIHPCGWDRHNLQWFLKHVMKWRTLIAWWNGIWGSWATGPWACATSFSPATREKAPVISVHQGQSFSDPPSQISEAKGFLSRKWDFGEDGGWDVALVIKKSSCVSSTLIFSHFRMPCGKYPLLSHFWGELGEVPDWEAAIRGKVC